MFPHDGMTPEAFLKRLDALLSDPAGRLTAPAAHLVEHLQPAQVREFLDKRLGDKPSLVKHLATILTLPTATVGAPAAWLKVAPSPWSLGLAAATLTYTHSRGTHRRRQKAIVGLISSFVLERAAISLDEKEKGLTRAMAALYADGRISNDDWARFSAQMTWADGKCSLMPAPDLAGHKHLPEARQALADVLKVGIDSHAAFLATTASRVAAQRGTADGLGRELTKVLSPGARWMTGADIEAGQVLSFKPSAAALIVGHDEESGRPIYFDGNQSLFSIGAPGVGKTECQVLPNLLNYRGSALVLDVKGELWDKSASWRQANVGPVYRWAPTDPSGRTHRFNPLDLVSNEAEQAATDCEVLSHQLVPTTPNHHDPYWENRGRDHLFAMAMVVALRSKGRARAMATLMRLLTVPLDVKPTAKDFASTEAAKLIGGLEEMATVHKVPALAEHAKSIRGGAGTQRIESVVDNARRFLNIFSRSATLRAAMSGSDWHPRQLRDRPGTTVYLCLGGDDLDTFAPILRLILQQHANVLLKDFKHKPGEPPITFFLDEFPQLKRMDSIMRMMDTGRGAGLRLWFFAQYLGQVRQAYDKQADGLINACKVRSFFAPDAEAAEFVKPYLGTTINLFTGEKTPLAEPHELVGREFAERILTLSTGPARLAKRFAWQTLADRIRPPPVIPQIK